jgi:glucokinase
MNLIPSPNLADCRKLIGVDLGGTNVRVGRVENGFIVEAKERAISSLGLRREIIEEVCETIQAVITPDTAAIGFGAPSVVDVEKGIVYSVINIPSWHEVPLKHILEDRFGLPAFINNDANCFAMGELYYGSGRGYRHLVGVILGTGLGAGIIVNGQLYSGANCGAGEIGSLLYRDKTLEDFCSGQFFQREHGSDGDELYTRAQQGDRQAQATFAAFGEHLGHAIMTILYAYDPEIIVLGGSVSNAFPFFEAAMRSKLEGFVYQHVIKGYTIVASQTSNVALLGAAALCLPSAAAGRLFPQSAEDPAQ